MAFLKGKVAKTCIPKSSRLLDMKFRRAAETLSFLFCNYFEASGARDDLLKVNERFDDVR